MPDAERQAVTVQRVPADGAEPVFSQTFGWEELAVLRGRVAHHAARAGVTGGRLEDFVLAVNELASNALRHGGGAGRVRLWVAQGAVRCEISDRGPGIPAQQIHADDPPSPLATGGRGIWLARQLCDRLTIASGRYGTTVQVDIALDSAVATR